MSSKLFGRQKPLYDLLGRGKVADIALWRNKRLSASILIGITTVWILFEVAEYHFLTLLCHAAIAAMLFVFIWSNGAAMLDLPPPRIPENILSEKVYTQAVTVVHRQLRWFTFKLHEISCGKDLALFLRTIGLLWVLAVLGSNTSSLTLLYFVAVVFLTLPALYDQYEDEVDHLAIKGKQDLKKLFTNVDTRFLNKIPRGPVKEKKQN
ncbi:reticulon family protein [Carex rostrata]